MGKFDVVHNRENTRSVKWDGRSLVFQTDDVLPMWVADMDFKAPEAVNDAIKERAEHGIYGYTTIDANVEDAIIAWNKNEHNWDIDRTWITYSPGVVTSILLAIQAFTEPGDSILIQTPVYPPFFDSISTHDRKIVTNSLVEKDAYYTIDFEDFEQKIKQGVKAFILCSPHNPVGRVWKKEELEKMAAICVEHNVLIISDEIHYDLVFPGHTHIPIASLSKEISDMTITCLSPTKTFNIAGLQTSYVITEDKEKRDILFSHFKKQGATSLNTIGNLALEASYRHGKEWLTELISVLESNKDYVIEQLEADSVGLKVVRAEGTYLLWVDCSSLEMTPQELQTFMIERAKVGLNAGYTYGDEGNVYVRINIGCPRETLEEGIGRIVDAVKQL